jgi:Na+(H+)/acetate symporter ActP
MTQVYIEEYEFFKRIKKLIPIIMLLCSILGGIITATWVSKDTFTLFNGLIFVSTIVLFISLGRHGYLKDEN